ncbi:tRNA glutamyl-Q(34) synthetase GluQRS [Alphaproteobacteria bacterium]|jgi:glutamyl-Q tRNA(Asp) synthetase|nr:tRNA glutamyl-Q(34) synthetase GluQRS [Alphaproteobacteria bacterium]
MTSKTRFAPSPSGYLHLGHAFSALYAWERAGRDPRNFILRFEDIDVARCSPEFEASIKEDLNWFGIDWNVEPLRQSERQSLYDGALQELAAQQLLYPCFCTRKDVEREVQAAVNAPHGPEGWLYPGSCRKLSIDEQQERQNNGEAFSLRLKMDKAVREAGDLTWIDRMVGEIPANPSVLGDVILARKDVGTSYHLAVTVDDAEQGVDLVTRGEDLFHASHLHRLLQALLRLPTPKWEHHPLVLDEDGKRFAKRNQSVTLRCLREAGTTPEEILEQLGL